MITIPIECISCGTILESLVSNKQIIRAETTSCDNCDLYGNSTDRKEIYYDSENNIVNNLMEEIVEEKTTASIQEGIPIECINCNTIIHNKNFKEKNVVKIKTTGCPRCKYNPEDYKETWINDKDEIIEEFNPFK